MILPARLRWLWLTLAVVFLDRASKAWIESRPASFFPHTVIPGSFFIDYSLNPWIAFSFLRDALSPAVLRVLVIFMTVVIIGVIAWMLVASRHMSSTSAAGLALLMGGAAGNMTDRILHGPVTDFLQVWLRFVPMRLFNPWPTFNVADAAVTVGAVLLIVDVLFHRQASADSDSAA
jgi:signal peptidase II